MSCICSGHWYQSQSAFLLPKAVQALFKVCSAGPDQASPELDNMEKRGFCTLVLDLLLMFPTRAAGPGSAPGDAVQRHSALTVS